MISTVFQSRFRVGRDGFVIKTVPYGVNTWPGIQEKN